MYAGTVYADFTSIPWTNLSNTTGAADGVFATVSLTGPQKSDGLYMVNFGFSIPSGATIFGVQVDVLRKATNSYALDDSVRLCIPGTGGSITRIGSDKSSVNPWNTTLQWDTFGSSSDLWGDPTDLTVANINGLNFGVFIRAVRGDPGGGSSTLSIDAVRISVTWGFIDSSTGAVTFTGTTVDTHRTTDTGAGTVHLSGVAADALTHGVAAFVDLKNGAITLSGSSNDGRQSRTLLATPVTPGTLDAQGETT
jgi:hypothetical protein